MIGFLKVWVGASALWSILVVTASIRSPFTYSLDLPVIGTLLWNIRDQIIVVATPWVVGVPICVVAFFASLRSRSN